MNGSSPQNFSKSLQRPANLAMMASMVAHAFLFAGLALVPATGQQNAKKSLRVVSLLQPSPEKPSQPKQPLDPNAPPPAPGVAGLPFNITTPGSLPELSTTNAPNAAFDPYSSSVVDLPSNPQPSLVPNTPTDPGPTSLAQPNPPASVPSESSDPDAPTLSDQAFQDWLNGTDELPPLTDGSGSSVPLDQPQIPPGSVAQSNIPPNSTNVEGGNIPPDGNSPLPQDPEQDPFTKSLAPPAQIVDRQVAYNYPMAACKDRLEGKAEFRIWVSPQMQSMASGIVVSSNSDILDRAVKVEARKYKITAADANKLVNLPFDFRYSERVCAADSKPPIQPSLDPTVPTSPVISPPPAPNTDEPTLEDKKGQNPSPLTTPSNPGLSPVPDNPSLSPTPSNPSPSPTQKLQPRNPAPAPTEPTLPEVITPSQPSSPLSAPSSSPKAVEPAPIVPPAAPTAPNTTPVVPAPVIPSTPVVPAAPISPPSQDPPAPSGGAIPPQPNPSELALPQPISPKDR